MFRIKYIKLLIVMHTIYITKAKYIVSYTFECTGEMNCFIP